MPIQILSTDVLPGSYFNAYSFHKTRFGALLGGWVTQRDIGPDKIYYWGADGSTGVLNWIWCPGPYHFNDPAVIAPVHPSRRNWLYMYCTVMHNKWPPLGAAVMVQHNHCFFATSVDNGKSWTPHEIVVKDCWSPGVIHTGEHIAIYSNDKDGWAQVTYMDDNGLEMLAPTERLKNSNNEEFKATNLHVSFHQGWWRLVANHPMLHHILLYVSKDRGRWHPIDGTGVIIADGANLLLTPELHGNRLNFSLNGKRNHEWQIAMTGGLVA